VFLNEANYFNKIYYFLLDIVLFIYISLTKFNLSFMTTIIIPKGRKPKYDTEMKSYSLNFRTNEEIQMFEHYKKAAVDMDEDVRGLIIESMKRFEKTWREK
jgi:hypothetical protein